MTLYRIYTENRSNLPELVSAKFESFTITPTIGYWKGKGESSAVIDILADAHDHAKVKNLARDIQRANEQESVLIVETEVTDAVSVEANGNAWLV